MFDRSIPIEGPTTRARRIAHAAINALGAGDAAAVVRTSGFSNDGRSQEFTADRAALRAAVDSPMVGQTNPPNMTSGGLSRPAYGDLVRTGDCVCGLCVLESIARTAEALALERTRQKLILWIGSGIVIQDRPATTGGACANLKDHRERAMRALATSNVTLHAIDPTGLPTLAATADPLSTRPLPSAHLERQADLAVLPAHTGGRTVLNTNTPELEVPRIFDESRSYYLLGFSPGDPGDSRRQRRIQVRVNRRDVEVRVRTTVYSNGEAR
jgi:VWFA-related protein